MALEIDLNSAYGIKLSYHRVTEVRYDYLNNSGAVTLSSYPDRATRLGNYAPLQFQLVNVYNLEELTLDKIYKAIKEEELFKGAKDV